MSELFRLPDSWVLTSIDEVCDFHAGFGFPTQMQGVAGQALPFYKVKDVSVAWHAHSALLLETEHSLSHVDADRIKAKPVPEGTVVFAKIGEALRLNRRAIVPRPSLIDNNLMGLSAPSTRLATRYLYWFAIATKFDVDARASVVPSIRKSDIGKLPFPLPPLAEQSRIVAKLEELLSDLDFGMAELKVAQKKLKQYRQSLLKAAVEGALTTEWRTQNTPAESGSQLLERILSERRARWKAKQLAKFAEQGKSPPNDWQNKYPEPVQPDTTGLPELQAGWVWGSLDMLGEIASGIAKGTKRDADVQVREVPYLRVANVQRGYLDLSEVKTILATERDIAELTLQAGDILFNEGGDRDKLGRGWVWRNEVANCIHQNHVFRMRPYLPEVLPELISHHGNTFGKTWFQNAGKQTTNLASINMTMLRMFPVPVGPAEEQRELLNQLELQIEHLNRQEQAVELGLKQSSAQRQNILRAAFAGQLAPQDPNDEPAALLLERIRAERAEHAKLPKLRKSKQQKEIAAVMTKLIDVLAQAADWVPAQEAFRRCGVADGALTDQIEELYAQLRALDKSGRLAVEAVTDAQGRKLHDRLKLLAA